MIHTFISLLILSFSLLAHSQELKSYQEINTRITALYKKQILEQHGLNLVIKDDQENDNALASCGISENNFEIFVGKNLAQNHMPKIDLNAYTFMICHEVGHLLGGTPLKTEWSSAEGQADYFAGQCLRNFGNDYQASMMAQSFFQAIHQVYSRLPKTVFSEESPSIDDMDSSVAKETYLKYPPSLQCRLDSVIQGALKGPRPACWFKN